MQEYKEVRNKIIGTVLHEMRGCVDDTEKIIPVAEKIADAVMREVCICYRSNTEVKTLIEAVQAGLLSG